MKMSLEPELKVQMELDAHEKECAVRYEMVHGKLETLDKRMWRFRSDDNGQYFIHYGDGSSSLYAVLRI